MVSLVGAEAWASIHRSIRQEQSEHSECADEVWEQDVNEAKGYSTLPSEEEVEWSNLY